MTSKHGGNALLNLASIRAKLESDGVRRFWRGLEELAETEEYKDFLDHEFAVGATDESGGVSRRNLLKLMGASAALAGLTACTKLPTEKIVPYVSPPEEIVPGKPLWYATAMPLGGFATGVLVESHMGRPTKVEGNPEHPASLGATDVFAQASVLDLYDPARSKRFVHKNKLSDRVTFEKYIAELRPKMAANGGAGLAFLVEETWSPTRDRLRTELQKARARA